MDTFFIAAATALWLGILTSISPCPLATNIAAMSFVGRHVASAHKVLLTGIFYMLGRSLGYVALAVLIVASVLSIPDLSYDLQRYMNMALGPLLVVTGIFLLGLIRLGAGGIGISANVQSRAERWGIWGAGLLGIIFSLSFCPVSAALFFGSLIPLAVKHNSGIGLPSLYGIGTALPVLLFAIPIAFGAQSVGRIFNRVAQIERWARRITAAIFIVVGVYFSLIYIFGVSI